MSAKISDSSISTTVKKSFRNDINGLRGWAVLAVVFYHFGIPGFGGGFIGVDVFFVISGFLMTAIIINGLEQRTFSLWRFYLARARRIIPALFVLCLMLLIFGWFWLPSTDYKILMTHVGTALAFISNVVFWRESGYFDSASHEKWLLHTWSLSVEWQFYIILPLICLLVWRWFRRQGTKCILIIVGMMSLILSIYASQRFPSAAFYLLPTRAWEMLAGGFIWWLTRQFVVPQQWAKLIEALGLSCITFSVITFNTSFAWPGVYAIVPVFGTMLVLGANRQSSWFTNNLVVQRLGASSYSLYLWHWPLVVVLVYAGEQNNYCLIGLGLVLTLVLGELSLRFVENPARKGLASLSNWQQFITFVLLVGGLAILAIYLRVAIDTKQSWIMKRFSNPEIEIAANEADNVNTRSNECLLTLGGGFKSPMCQYGKGPVESVVLGDSHANATVNAVAAVTPGSTIELSYAGCSTVFGLERVEKGSQCSKFNTEAINLINTKFTTQKIFITNRAALPLYGFNETDSPKPNGYFDKIYEAPSSELDAQFSQQLVKTVCSIKNSERVYLVRPYPEMTIHVPKALSRALLFGKPDPKISISMEQYRERQLVIWKAQDEAASHCGVNILNPLPYLCNSEQCFGSKDGRPVYSDDNHISGYGNELLVPMFRQAFEYN